MLDTRVSDFPTCLRNVLHIHCFLHCHFPETDQLSHEKARTHSFITSSHAGGEIFKVFSEKCFGAVQTTEQHVCSHYLII